VPSRNDVKKCVITEASITQGIEPQIVTGDRTLLDEPQEQTA